MSGWSELGAALAGIGNDGTAQRRGMVDAARGEKLLLDARRARDENLARQGYEGALEASGLDPRVAHLLSVASRADFGGHVGKVGEYTGAMQDQAIQQQALDAALANHPNAMNRILAVMHGQPVDLTSVEGNTVINPTVTPGAQQVASTPLGRAMADNERAGGSSTPHIQAGKDGALFTVNADGTAVPIRGPNGEQLYQNDIEAAAKIYGNTHPFGAMGPNGESFADFYRQDYPVLTGQQPTPTPAPTAAPSPYASADAVRAAFHAGTLTREQAMTILRNQFGMQ